MWLSYFFSAIVSILIYTSRRDNHYSAKNKRLQVIIASVIMAFPFIVSTLTFIEYRSIHQSIIPGLLVMDMSLIFFQYFMILPFSLVDPVINRKPMIYRPLVSVIVPAYNEEKWIKQTLGSLLEVDYENKEIVVVDDGSTDSTYYIASMMGKSNQNIRVFQKVNGGKASAINYGLLVSSGEIVVITDADGLVSHGSLKEIVGFFRDPNVVGVAGNIRVINKNNVLTYCQAVEYAVGINLHRAATTSFGVVEVLPGPLSAFRRRAIDKVGGFDSDTLVEDADFTKKLLKTGNVLQCTSRAFAYTEAPSTLRGFIKQRTRWYRGNIQTFLKHKDIRDYLGNLFLSSILYPWTFLQIFVQPWLGPVALLSFFISLYSGTFKEIQNIFIVFLFMQFIISGVSVKKGEEDPKLILFSPFLILGYKHLIDLIKIRCIIEHIVRRQTRWNKLDRTGPQLRQSAGRST
jgi:cellulose synthase/poly-beta-1,6-N-acetylglucosamine synthase-like glycosyltransferase